MSKKGNTTSYTILLNSVDNAVKFVRDINKLDGNFDLNIGNSFFDAKSLLGVLSIDPHRPMKLYAVCDDTSSVDAALEPYIA